ELYHDLGASCGGHPQVQGTAGGFGGPASDVQTQAARSAGARAAVQQVPAAEAGALVTDEQGGEPLVYLQPYGQRRALRGMREAVPQQRVDTGREFLRADAHQGRAVRKIEVDLAGLLVGERRPEPDPLPDDLHRVTDRLVPPVRPPGLVDQLSHGP